MFEVEEEFDCCLNHCAECDQCYNESHYHCARCGKVSGMMGHSNCEST